MRQAGPGTGCSLPPNKRILAPPPPPLLQKQRLVQATLGVVSAISGTLELGGAFVRARFHDPVCPSHSQAEYRVRIDDIHQVVPSDGGLHWCCQSLVWAIFIGMITIATFNHCSYQSPRELF